MATANVAWAKRGLRQSLAGLLGAALLVLVGCSGGGSVPAGNPQVTVTGSNQVRLGTPQQFTAMIANSTATMISWQVSGITGGTVATGTISATGLYTPPAVIPTANIVTITAAVAATVPFQGSISASILNPIPVVTSAQATQSAIGTMYVLDILGTGFLPASQVQVAGSMVTATYVTSTELRCTITVASGVTTVPVVVTNPDPGTMNVSSSAQVLTLKASVQTAARLLDQATFGPTLNDINHVQLVGASAYLAEQFAAPTTMLPDIATPAPLVCVNNTIPCEQSEWWQAVLTGNDQLRQRVAFALSEIFVVSTNSVNARALTTYHNTLANDAFGNFYTLLQDVTLSPAMGAYLNMLNSNKPGLGQIANENYPRELMQLFTTGIYLLNSDGSQQLDGSGNPIPVYTETQVQAFARAYTGWTYAPIGTTTSRFTNPANYSAPMVAIESAHDMTAKVLLNGTVLPSGQNSTTDLSGALGNLFTHPNVGPFFCKQLIQHLVASSPSPAYVGRVAAVFANDGAGKRGNMKAVITAILSDVDARAADTSPNFDGGHLREPMLYIANVMRALSFVNKDAVAGNDVVALASYNTVGNYTSGLGQRPYSSASVFNFFSPEYVIPGTTVNAPEFGQENTATAVLRLTLANTMVYNGISNFNADLSRTSALGIMASKTGNATTDSGNLVDALGVMFMHGQMPSQMRSAIVGHIATLTDPATRVRVATYLVITSSFYKVEH